jgi:hypothetical protein
MCIKLEDKKNAKRAWEESKRQEQPAEALFTSHLLWQDERNFL